MQAVVVTGAGGFIGRALCQELLRRGTMVYGLGRRKYLALPGVTYAPLAEYDQMGIPPGAVCIHLAGRNAADCAVGDFQDELRATTALAKKIVTGRVTTALFVSSALVYGDHVQRPRQEDEPISPTGGYAAIKAAVEEIFLSYGHTVVRLANVYGPGMSPVNVFSDVLKQIPGSGDIRVRDVVPIRDYIHVSDVAQGLADLALGSTSGIFNLGTGEGTSVGQLASHLAVQAGEVDRRVVPDAKIDRSSTLILDPTKMRATLGWQATISLGEGMKDVLEQRSRMQLL